MKKTLINVSMFLYVAMQFGTASVVEMQPQNVQQNAEQEKKELSNFLKNSVRQKLLQIRNEYIELKKCAIISDSDISAFTALENRYMSLFFARR